MPETKEQQLKNLIQQLTVYGADANEMELCQNVFNFLEDTEQGEILSSMEKELAELKKLFAKA